MFSLGKPKFDEIDKILDEELEQEEPSRFPETFRWDNEGDTLKGQVKGIRHVSTEMGETPVATIEDRKGDEWSLWLSPMDLARKWSENNVEVGDHIAVRYIKLAGRMKAFRLAVVHTDGTKVSADFVVEPLPLPLW